MGRNLKSENSAVQFEDQHHHQHNSACMWGMLHMLDHHHWPNVKKKRPKHGRGTQFRCIGTPKTNSFNSKVDDNEDLMESETAHFLIEQDMETSSTKRSCGKAYTKDSISTETVREEIEETDYVRHLEPPDHTLHDSVLQKAHVEVTTCNKDCDMFSKVNAVDCKGNSQLVGKPENYDEVKESTMKQKRVDSEELKKESSHDQLKNYADVLGTCKVNNEFFQKSLQHPSVGTAGHSIKSVKFTKSVSFPVADSRIRYSMPSTPQHKKNEVWSFPKGDRFLKGTQMPNLVASKSIKDYYAGSTPFVDDHNLHSDSLSHRSVNQGWTKLFRNHFIHIKHRIKHAFKDSKKKHHQASMERVLNKDPGGNGTDKPLVSFENDRSENASSKSTFQDLKRSSSPVESMDRYVWLFDYNFIREAKWHQPRSLKLTSEDKLPSRGHTMSSYRRNSSLPNMDSFCSLLTEVSRDTLHSAMPIKTSMDHCKEIEYHQEPNLAGTPLGSAKYEQSNSAVGPKLQWNLPEGSDMETEYQFGLRVGINKHNDEIDETEDQIQNENVAKLMVSENSPRQEQESGLEMNLSQQEIGNSTPLSDCANDIISSVELPDSTGLDEADCSDNLESKYGVDSAPDFCIISCPENVAGIDKIADNKHLLHFKLDKNHEAEFNYVRDVLELSGFIGNKYIGTWHSLDQPLNLSLFDDLETILHCELEYSEDDTTGYCDHQLLFDLVNEVLLDIYKISLSYFPKAFSYGSRTRPLPTGHRLLEEVWARIGQYLSLRPELEESLDHVVADDLSKGIWMNLQMDAECVELELEELIFHELLDEAICTPDC